MPATPTVLDPILARVISPAPVVVLLIVRSFKEVVPPMAPPIEIFPAPVSIVKPCPPALVALTVEVLAKVTVVLAASASIATSAVSVTGPVIEIAPPAASEVLMLPPSLTESTAVPVEIIVKD